MAKEKGSSKNSAGSKSSTQKVSVKLVSENRKARFDYTIVDTIEAGVALLGSEVKSLRENGIQLKDSYIVFKNGEVYLQGAHIAPYRASSYLNHEPERLRKLLLSSVEIDRLDRSMSEKGFTCVPLKLYFKGRWAKIEIGIAKGKQGADKREAIKSRDVERELRQAKAKR
ncbi:MAG: SsrA-binding protein SmpB [Bdellovibrionales bacterium]|nr:SsrA-binding protein SmpB [Bdellovibrionales bacterium]